MTARGFGFRSVWLVLAVLLAGGCGVDSAERGAGGGGGQAAGAAGEKTGEARAALVAGAGSVGDCNGNPARCAAVSLAAGAQHTLALQSSGTVWAWGDNGSGQLGDTAIGSQNMPVQVSALTGVIAIAAGDRYTIALKSDGTVWGCGANGQGQLGNGVQQMAPSGIVQAGLSNVSAIAAGNYHAVALTSNGTVWTWGGNNFGQLGLGYPLTPQLTPTMVPGLTNITAVAAGYYFTLALESDGTVWAWGDNASGQLERRTG